MNDKDSHDNIITKLIGALIAFGIVTIGFIVLKIIWPLMKYLAKKFIAKFRGKPEENQQTIDESTFVPEIKTPDIFKGAKNLGIAKDIEF